MCTWVLLDRSERANDLCSDYTNDGQPIASGGWSPAIDAASQNNWDIRVGSAVNKAPIIQAGNSNDSPPTWGAAELIATENSTVKQYVKTYAHHNYPGGTVTSLMSHTNIASNLHVFDADVTAALGQGKPYVFGETNSGTIGTFDQTVTIWLTRYLISLGWRRCYRVAHVWGSPVDARLFPPRHV